MIRVLLSYLKNVHRYLVVFVGLIIHLTVYTFIFLNLPDHSPLDKDDGHGVFQNPRLSHIIKWPNFDEIF